MREVEFKWNWTFQRIYKCHRIYCPRGFVPRQSRKTNLGRTAYKMGKLQRFACVEYKIAIYFIARDKNNELVLSTALCDKKQSRVCRRKESPWHILHAPTTWWCIMTWFHHLCCSLTTKRDCCSFSCRSFIPIQRLPVPSRLNKNMKWIKREILHIPGIIASFYVSSDFLQIKYPFVCGMSFQRENRHLYTSSYIFRCSSLFAVSFKLYIVLAFTYIYG